MGGPPPEGLADEAFPDPQSDQGTRIYTKRGGFLNELSRLDPGPFGTLPVSVIGGEPDQFLAPGGASEALAEAGFQQGGFDASRTGIVLGHTIHANRANRANVNGIQHGRAVEQTIGLFRSMIPELPDDRLAALEESLKSKLPDSKVDAVPGLVPSMMTGRIADRLDLMDAACASTLVFMVFCRLGAVSRWSRIRPFDRGADGTLLGAGQGIVVLKRLDDARRDGDRVSAVIEGVGKSSDRRDGGLMAPRLEGEIAAIERAYAQTAPAGEESMAVKGRRGGEAVASAGWR